MARKPVLTLEKEGLYCPVGGFYIDPWKPVDRAIITHGHSDHARWGMRSYLCSPDSVPILQRRLEPGAQIFPLEYGQTMTHNGVKVTLHPAGHVLGSAQVRVELDGEIWVVSGDYKTESDVTCSPFELVRCHTFITETTFGLPVYRWEPQSTIFDKINTWWRNNQIAGKSSVIFAYALGKSQRILGGIDPSIGPIILHGAVVPLTEVYRQQGIELPITYSVTDFPADLKKSDALVIAPPSAAGTPWMRRFEPYSDAMASGWMRVRGIRRRRALDRGFVLSDHVDWPSLIATIKATGAESVFTTHGYADTVARFVCEEMGLECKPLATPYEGEGSAAVDDEEVVADE
ncbi:MAG: ligase-associated DNA damage response exonuclease [Armatimonadetes bacterium]|nr:ligase-associated DNA damage response exonuclease [Armatimonadota bacterium]